jgi:hypothetical protein
MKTPNYSQEPRAEGLEGAAQPKLNVRKLLDTTTPYASGEPDHRAASVGITDFYD